MRNVFLNLFDPQQLPEEQKEYLKILIQTHLQNNENISLEQGIAYPIQMNNEEINITISDSIDKNKRLDMPGGEEYLIINGGKVGSGVHAKVTKSNHTLAILYEDLCIWQKVKIKKEFKTNIGTENVVVNELSSSAILQHRTPYGYINNKGAYSFFAEMETGVPLRNLLNDKEALKNLNIPKKNKLILSLFNHIIHLHEIEKKTHGDIHAGNIIYNEARNTLRLIDAGDLADLSEKYISWDLIRLSDIILELIEDDCQLSIHPQKAYFDTLSKIASDLKNNKEKSLSNAQALIEGAYAAYLVVKTHISDPIMLLESSNNFLNFSFEVPEYKKNIRQICSKLNISSTDKSRINELIEGLDNLCEKASMATSLDHSQYRKKYSEYEKQINSILEKHKALEDIRNLEQKCAQTTVTESERTEIGETIQTLKDLTKQIYEEGSMTYAQYYKETTLNEKKITQILNKYSEEQAEIAPVSSIRFAHK